MALDMSDNRLARRRFLRGAAGVAGLMLSIGGVGIVSAGVTKGDKCNSGRGNNSETEPSSDCDPGNSGGRNQGGD